MRKTISMIVVLSVIIVSGCTQTPPSEHLAPLDGTPSDGSAVCGNNVIESGEECDGSGCTSPEICEECECISLQPPPLPD